MPDRDIIPSGRSRGWGSARRLFVENGVSSETVTAVARAEAASLRRQDLRSAEREEFDVELRNMLDRNLLGPSRVRGVQKDGVDEVQLREGKLWDALHLNHDHLFSQMRRGKRLTARPTQRMSAGDSLAYKITTLSNSRTVDSLGIGGRV